MEQSATKVDQFNASTEFVTSLSARGISQYQLKFELFMDDKRESAKLAVIVRESGKKQRRLTGKINIDDHFEVLNVARGLSYVADVLEGPEFNESKQGGSKLPRKAVWLGEFFFGHFIAVMRHPNRKVSAPFAEFWMYFQVQGLQDDSDRPPRFRADVLNFDAPALRQLGKTLIVVAEKMSTYFEEH